MGAEVTSARTETQSQRTRSPDRSAEAAPAEVPTLTRDLLARQFAGRSTRNSRYLLHMQQAGGNHAVSRLIAAAIAQRRPRSSIASRGLVRVINLSAKSSSTTS